MSEPEVFPLAQVPITSHAFNADRSQLAVSLNSHEATIFTRQGSEWKESDVLSEHDKLITSIDWAPNTNRIVTASQDRNAYVWSLTPEGKWKPTLVLLRINRAATYVRWSPNEDKFAVASGARAIAICSFDPENDWWVSKLLKKPLRSTVLSIDWHPNNVLLASGSADAKTRVFSAYVKDIDKRPPPSVWGEKLPFNTVCGEYASPAGGWVHSVGFSPSGDALAFVSHDSSISIVYPSSGQIYTIRTTSLPFTTLAWTSEQSFVAAGHDCQPIVLSGNETTQWSVTGTLDEAKAGKSAGSNKAAVVGRLNSAAFNTFRNADSRGVVNAPTGTGETELGTIHQNTITNVRAYEGVTGAITRVSTSGVDGKLVVWNVDSVTALTGKLGATSIR